MRVFHRLCRSHKTLRASPSLGLIFLASMALSGCSIPNLETPQCTAARDTVKRFYSFHFGNDMTASPDNIKARQAYLTPELFTQLSASGENARDYFTATDTYPKAFRVGRCTAVADDKVTIQILLLWKDDTKSDQKEVEVESLKQGDRWLINKVSG